MAVVPRQYTSADQKTWEIILDEHEKKRERQVCPLFLNGLKTLGITKNRIPDLKAINQILMKKTGFCGVLVEGLEEGPRFYQMLARREFPIGNFIRKKKDINYTPAPDIVHDIYGHLPFYVDKSYADFCQIFGQTACQYSDRPHLFRQFERFFWFTIEFGLIRTQQGVRIFGAGIASSVGECDYALSEAPKVMQFDVDSIRHQEFRIDEMQPVLFCFDHVDELYSSLKKLVAKVKEDS